MAEIGRGYESPSVSPTRIRGRLPPCGGPASQAHASNRVDRCVMLRRQSREPVRPPFVLRSLRYSVCELR